MKSFQNRTAVITGAASGIGRALAFELAGRGCHLAISDIAEDRLLQTASELSKLGINVHYQVLDVADLEAFEAYRDAVVDQFDRVHLMINNAGVAVTASVRHTELEDFEWLMNINFWGVVYGTKLFLPHMEDHGEEGCIVNISSVFGLIGVPLQSAYNAAKFAVRGFTESLGQELAIGGSAIWAASVHPGGVKTDIVRGGRHTDLKLIKQDVETLIRRFDEELARLTPEEAARIIIRGIEQRNPRILVGNDARILDTIQRLLPRGYRTIVAKLMARDYRGTSR